MDNQPEEFQKLITLMKVKRYEAPPPGYFDRFSAQVIARIEVLSRRQPSWFERFILSLGDRPALAASCGALMGAFLVAGFLISQPKGQPEPMLMLTGDIGIHALGHPSARPHLVDSYAHPMVAAFLPTIASNAMPAGLVFGDDSLRVITADFSRLQW
jgi:hypothetical protein